MKTSSSTIRYKNHNLYTALVAVIMIFFVLLVLFPFFWLFTASIKPDKYITTKTLYFFPPEVTLSHYVQVFTFANLGRIFLNSTIVSSLTVVVSLLCIIPAAYALSILRVKGRKVISRFILSLQMLPGILLVIPLYIIMQKLRLIDTYAALIISYTTFTTPFCFMLLSAYYSSLPMELFESAYLDGASSFYSLLHIAIPLTMPGIVTVATYSFLMGWNDFLYANTFTNSVETRTLTVEVIRLVGTWGDKWGDLAAGATVTVFPVIILFLLANKNIISGLTAGSVKG